VLTRKRAGWLLRGEQEGGLDDTLTDLLRTMEHHQELLQDHLRVLRANTERLREQRQLRREQVERPVDSA